jgi:hypothetical protein
MAVSSQVFAEEAHSSLNHFESGEAKGRSQKNTVVLIFNGFTQSHK